MVDSSLGGCDVTIERYLVFYAPSSNGPYYYHGWTADTTYLHAGVITYAPGMFYQVVAMDVEGAMMEFERGERSRVFILGSLIRCKMMDLYRLLARLVLVTTTRVTTSMQTSSPRVLR